MIAAYPRMDIIHNNIVWQRNYSTVNYNHVKNVKVRKIGTSTLQHTDSLPIFSFSKLLSWPKYGIDSTRV
jgi:hypothetical protein